MCGLAGILRFDDGPVAPDPLEAARPHLLCRGPDDTGLHLDGPCGLVHTRLAVIDPADGRQPMSLPPASVGGGERRGAFADGDSAPALTVVFNGMIYNHRALRRQLGSLGHVFRTDHSDTEVLLHGYRRWGTDLPARLEGMFAFALWDAAERSLFLARDRAGKKPLYFHRTERRFACASLISALLALLDARPDIDPRALTHYLTFGYTDERSLLSGVHELPAAHWMLVRLGGATHRQCYWRPPPVSRTDTPKGVDDAVERVLREAVAARLESDAPLGCFLSGGIDSSLIAAFAQQQLRERGGRLRTFSVAMPDARYDEGPAARRVAGHLGTEHHQLIAEPRIEDDLRRLIAMMGEPLADSSILPAHWLSRAAREHITVALSGDGGDELFAGYDRYRALRLLRMHRRWLRLIPPGLLPSADQKSPVARFGRLLEAARPCDPAEQYLSMIQLFTPNHLAVLGLDPDSRGQAAPDRARMPDWSGSADPPDAARRWDLLRYLPFDLLRKVDRASMAVALEVRCPMLDTAVIDLAAHLPSGIVMARGRPKALLRRLAARYLPRSIARRRKMGFAIPLGSWLADSLRPLLSAALLDDSRLSGLGFHRPALERMIADHAAARADHTHRLFALLSLALWLDWLDDPRPAEGVLP